MINTVILKNRFFMIAVLSLSICFLLNGKSKAQGQVKTGSNVEISKSDPWTGRDIIMPETLTAELKNSNRKPFIIQIGFKMLFDQAHIPGAVFTGPAFKKDGIESLKDALRNVSHNKNIVIYCGCCKWIECPNIRPAFKSVKEMGFKNVKVLYLKDTFMIDWVNKGYPSTEH